MKRLHVSFGVEDLEKSVLFYSTLFGAEPSVRRPGYAKWMLEDPRVNFVVESLSGEKGFSHAGIQVEEQEELEPIFNRLKEAEAPYLPEGVTTCCYHKSEKSWTQDPDGVRWEAFYTMHQMEEFGSGPELEKLDTTSADQSACGCSAPAAEAEKVPAGCC
ncbi:ArsI/CadI family heavy metal resistance metalloenzyme [Parvibaculum sp.]|jgi:catechol 2,3-dioxygenase-like lactoylglutathione lyase family enzyme|uniref:ArsI/CadI family heavy metal resistance metalloenzyme n=1 Tax=Parvibaculum sp. TaxID=2024848 RepID=UPI001B03834D|nr:ArsI/CadI family heavy metal resistance metalloenzyme [Parvibaculum sp.]MBO6636264.1 VOC family protein [Parvibaculum sp.]MBO6677258.1 VOC family protein [Parvibaculum sp.]MBO6684820.1 VOC family protein [Parvibaculum sp.]MBO6904244.1 VOC family protein [Parvibaculum sp.]